MRVSATKRRMSCSWSRRSSSNRRPIGPGRLVGARGSRTGRARQRGLRTDRPRWTQRAPAGPIRGPRRASRKRGHTGSSDKGQVSQSMYALCRSTPPPRALLGGGGVGEKGATQIRCAPRLAESLTVGAAVRVIANSRAGVGGTSVAIERILGAVVGSAGEGVVAVAAAQGVRA